MTLEEIKKAVDNGETIYWSNRSYKVKKDPKLDRYYIEHLSGCIFMLTGKNGELSDRESSFFAEKDLTKEAEEANFIVR